MEKRPLGDVVCDALDPLLVSLGFAAGQGRGAFNSLGGFGVTYCTGQAEFAERFPWMPQAATDYDPEGWECADVIVDGSSSGVIENVWIEAYSLEETFRELGLDEEAEQSADLIGQNVSEVLEPLDELLRKLFRA